MPASRHTSILLGAALIGTVAHLSVTFGRAPRAARAGGYSSELPRGAALPPLALAGLAGAADASRRDDPGAGRCRLLVVASASCRHCRTAVARDVDRAATPRLPMLFVSVEDGPGARRLAADAAPLGPTRYAPGVLRALRVTGVPTAFLVTAADTVLRHWAYTGAEDHARLGRECR